MSESDSLPVDPVCHMEVNSEQAAADGRILETKRGMVYFCSHSCLQEYQSENSIESTGWSRVEVMVSVTLIVVAVAVSLTGYMLPFMGFVFVILAITKLIDIPGFVERFVQYDVVASRVKVYGYVYPFIELALATAFLLQSFVIEAAVVTAVVMGVGAVGVGMNVFSSNQKKCACLGARIPVPLTRFTLVEDITMALMALIIIINAASFAL